MPLHAEHEKRNVVEQAITLSGSVNGPNAAFVREFYRNVPPDDILARAPEDLLAAAASLWTFMSERRSGRAKLRIIGPKGGTRENAGADPDSGEEHRGWLRGRTVIEVVNDDMPFLVDSLTAALNRLDLVVHLVIHPVLPVARDETGKFIGLAAGTPQGLRESAMHIEIAGAVDPARHPAILAKLDRVLSDVRRAVLDWEGMTRLARRMADELGNASLPVPASEAAEVSAFLDWVADGNFTFLGYREYLFAEGGLAVVPHVGRGLLRDDDYLVFDGLRNFAVLPPEVQQFLRSPQLIMISKSNRLSTVHRAVQMDTVVIKCFDAEGMVAGLKLVIGLFTSSAYAKGPKSIPLLRRKVQHALDRAGFDANSHDGKVLQHILDTFPRNELFQMDEAELFETSLGILHLQERQRIALFARRDPFERFVSCLVFVPRDRYNTAVRRRMGEILAGAFHGTLGANTAQLDESVLARLHFIVNTVPGQVPALDLKAVEQQLVEAGRVWSDRLGEALVEAHGEEQGHSLLHRFADAFPAGYIDQYGARTAVEDIAGIERLRQGQPIALAFSANPGANPGEITELRLKTFHAGKPIALSDILPMLENLGFKVITEMPFSALPSGGERVWIQEFELAIRGSGKVDLARSGKRLADALAQVFTGAVENDGFNRLVPAGLWAREAVVLRTYCKILRQAGSTFSQAYMEDTLALHYDIAILLFRVFEAQFGPEGAVAEHHGLGREAAANALAAEIEAALEAVSNLDEDRILRNFLLLIRKTLRTNYNQIDAEGRPKPYLSVKLASREIDLLPLPRPLVEIFVYSPRMEGCHLRGGKVARGGIRWSDRKEDFRTEILGLMKAQMVKNSVIVPVGSKGGFVVKQPPLGADRDTLMAEVVACYKMLMFGLLDITDTLDGDHVVPPAHTVRRDGDDPYLVVAADKGTATFSDIANGVALDYGFWLGDAFASGGSVGYDHKAMGITARGAWEAVKRHFREIGTDIQTTGFTCIGVGDMSGDVFGNGMLLSQHIRLVAAFNHQHIFLDPAPDAAASWAERKRLFDLSRSSWKDYDVRLISEGGGIFERSAKSIPLSPQVRALLGVADAFMPPARLIQTLLRHEADLLWFGGIGTYVKSSRESQAEAGDRANDALRIDGREIRAKVVGEGANLGVTQRGRIEYALGGGRINTDAIDNSAGVDTSDHEVNIKIAVGGLVGSGKLAAAERSGFLAAMTEEVAELVLEDNYLQTQALSLAEAEAVPKLDRHVRLIRALEKAGRLDRAIEFLPDDETLAERESAGRGLTRPELAVLLAYAKNAVYDELLESDLPDEPELAAELRAYFPPQIVTLAQSDLGRHRLHREIVATHVTNAMINRLGADFVTEMQAKTGRNAADIARAYRIARDVFDLPAAWAAVEALDNRIPAPVQIRLLLDIRNVAKQASTWFLQSGLALDIAARVAEFAEGVHTVAASLDALLPEEERQENRRRVEALAAEGVPEDLARRITILDRLVASLDIVRIDERSGLDLAAMARLYFAAGARIGLAALRERARKVPATTAWQHLAVAALQDDFDSIQRDIVENVLREGQGSVDERLDTWLDRRAENVARIRETAAEVARTPRPDLAILTVAARQLRALTSR